MIAYKDELPNVYRDSSKYPETCDIFENCTLNLVDYGFATSYLKKGF